MWERPSLLPIKDEKESDHMRKYAVLLLLSGLLIIVWPQAEHWIEDYRQQKLLSSWEQVNSEDQMDSVETSMLELTKLFKDERTDAAKVQEPSPISDNAVPIPGSNKSVPSAAPIVSAKSEAKVSNLTNAKPQESKPKKQTMVGVLRIEDIELELPVLEGVSSSNLKIGAGHIPGTDAPGAIGNFVIAAHRSYSYGRLFNRLEELNVGNEITIRTAGANFTYTIYEIKKAVDPNDLSVLNRNDKDKVLTLITCTEDGAQRVVIHASLKTL
jgi:sortase A